MTTSFNESSDRVETIFKIDDAQKLDPPNTTFALEDGLPTRWMPFDFTALLEPFRLALEVLNTIERYGKHTSLKAIPSHESLISAQDNPLWLGKMTFFPRVFHYVQQRQPVVLTLPAFPCKSSNRGSKVLGRLPDLGEVLALRRLDALGKDIGRVYAPGAQVIIATDGVLFNDILGISDEDCWDYGEALKAIIIDNGLTSLRFSRPMNLLNLLPEAGTNRDSYLATSELCRLDLMARFGSSEDAISAAILNDRDTGLTYCGMVKFLESEMKESPEFIGLKNIAKKRIMKANARKMMLRSEAFTLAIRKLRPLDVRLSIHPSSGATKLSFPLIPTPDGNFQRSPWHSCVVVGADGLLRCIHSGEVDKETHDLVYRQGRPWFYCERSFFNMFH